MPAQYTPSESEAPDSGGTRQAALNDRELRSLPMRARFPILIGALAGLLLRLVFSGPAGSKWSAMAGAFVFLTPIVVGMVTVYLAERLHRRSWTYYWSASALATALFVAGTLVILIEGLICAIVIIPMFAVLGALGGLVMGALCRWTDWPKRTIYSVAALPVLLALFGQYLPSGRSIGSIERSVLIEAPPAVIWQQLNRIQNISTGEMADAWAMRIGVPMPMSGETEWRNGERLRRSRWGKQVYFDEVISDWQPERSLRWTYRFHEDSFPRQALDDHVVIGGHYFDLIDTTYELIPDGKGTRLTTRVHYRISTQFNFYADWVAQLLLGNLSEVGLKMYKLRSETAASANPSASASANHAK